MFDEQQCQSILQRFNELEHALMHTAAGGGDSEFASLSREYSKLKPLAETIQTFVALKNDIAELQTMQDDPDMRALISEELTILQERLKAIATDLQNSLVPKDANDTRPVIIEIRPGTGGEEAALFVSDLLRMYQRYSEEQRWRFDIMTLQETGIGGLKEVIANVTGSGAFAALKYESGVHRVQRVPITEAGGRVHTSAATVAVLPEPQAVDIDIKDSDLRIDTMRASGAGGQHVNKTDSAVRITHLPSKIVVMASQKSQHQNRALAMKILRARLYDIEQKETIRQRSELRSTQVGTGDRSERIRTYNYPQGRVTDHRINMTLYKLEHIMNGDLQDFIVALTTHDEAAKRAMVGLSGGE